MRKLVLFFCLIFLSSVGMAQDFDQVVDALKQGDARAISTLLDATVDITIDGQLSTVGRGDAETKLRTFFMNHEPRNFETMHKGESESHVHYMIGHLLTSNGGYQVTLYMHKGTDEYRIRSLEFEKQ